MGILRITMMKMSSHRVSGPFTHLSVPPDAASNPAALTIRKSGGEATS
jgi:hypothetical protein